MKKEKFSPQDILPKNKWCCFPLIIYLEIIKNSNSTSKNRNFTCFVVY